MSLLLTFLVGGFFMPVVHKVDHSAEWSRQLVAAHSHADIDARSVLTVCADVDSELPDCRLCHRDWLDRFDPDQRPQEFDRLETILHLDARVVPHSLKRTRPIRAPPVLA